MKMEVNRLMYHCLFDVTRPKYGVCRTKTCNHLVTIRVTSPRIVYPLASHFYKVNMGLTGVYISSYVYYKTEFRYSLELPQ